MSSITTATSPNTQRDDFWLTLKSFFKPWIWRKGDGTIKLENIFKQWLPRQYAFAFESGRGALFAILSSLKLNQGDEVLLQAYTCVAVPDPVLWAGLKPIYVDINEATFNMSAEDLEKKITSKSKVLIIQHTFGLPADIDKLVEIAKKHNLFVIEDCAHALGAEYQGKKVGTFGDAVFFSFGRDKIISSVWGGMATTNNQNLAESLAKFYNNCSAPNNFWILQQLMHPIVFSVIRPTFNYFGRFLLAILKKIRFISVAVFQKELQGGKPDFIPSRLPNVLAILALHQFDKLETYNNHRIALADFYAKNLAGLKLSLPVTSDGRKHIFLRYTIKSADASLIIAKAKNKGIYLGDWYNCPITPCGVNYDKIYYQVGSCPNAEKAASQSFNLPTHINISQSQAQKIVDFLKKVE